MTTRVVWLVALLAGCVACSSSSPTGTGGGTNDAGSDSGGGGVPQPCAISVSSSTISGSTTPSTGGSCTSTLVNQTTIGIKFTVVNNGDTALGSISCTISPTAGSPQTLHGRSGTTGCNIEVSYDAATGATDMWADDASSTINIVATDIPTASGTLDVTLYDAANVSLVITGTF